MDSRDSNHPKPPRCTKKWKGKEKMDASTKKWKGKEKMDASIKKWKGKEKMDAYIPQDDHQNEENMDADIPQGDHQNKDNQIQPLVPNQLSNITSDETQKRIIAEFFYENNVSPYVVTSRSFRNLLDLGGRGASLQTSIPTVQELRGSILYNEAHTIRVHVQEMKQLWQVNGCSIILDGWDDAQGRKLMNFLVDCPYGVVYLRSLEISPSSENIQSIIKTFDDLINEVGTGNVLQVISHTTVEPWLEVVGSWIKETHRSVFWSISVTHCLSLMLDKMASSISWVTETIAEAKKITSLVYNNSSLLSFMARTKLVQSDYGHVLVVPSKLRATTPFLTLKNMLSRENDLKLMFSSPEWVQSHLGSSPRGTYVSTLVSDKSFWTNVTAVVKATTPIVAVLNLFNKGNIDDNSPQMGILYETMDQMKETISREIEQERAESFWTIIDDIWNKTLHCGLHAAGYYLNPRIFYTDDFFVDSEVIEGVLSAVLKTGGDDVATQSIIIEQLRLYENGFGSFKQGIRERNKFPPVEWWMRFGSHCPELQTLAMKVLGLTCNGASSYELRREVAENLLSVSETHPSYEWLKTFAFVCYNVHLKQVKQPGFKLDMDEPDIDSLDDWLRDEH